MAKATGVYDYPTKSGKKWRWSAELRGAEGQGKGLPSQRAAIEARAAWLGEQYAGLGMVDRVMTLERFWNDRYVPLRRGKVADGSLRSSTVKQNERDGRVHILPKLGKRRLRDIGVEDIERFGASLPPGSATRIVNTLGNCMTLAVRYRHVAYNPVRDAEKPRVRRSKPVLPSLEDVIALAVRAASWNDMALILSAVYTGARKSELFALAWPDVSLTEGDERLVIVRQFYKGELVEATKTGAGAREIPLGPHAIQLFKELSAFQIIDERPNPHGLLFPSPTGSHWLDSNFDRRVWGPLREAAGLPGLKFHTLRYLFVSLLRTYGKLPSALSEQLTGHVDERTHRGYTRPIPGTEPLIRDALGRAFTPKEEA